MRLICTWLLVLLMALADAGAESPLFTQGEPHKSHLDYRQYFETMAAVAGDCTLAIAQADYAPELAQQLYDQVAADEAAFAALAPLRPHTVYVVKKPLAGLQRLGSAVYCTAAEVLDGSYRPLLAEVAFGAEAWQGAGLAGYVFGPAADESALAAWYADDSHDDMLSLFHAYFVPEFVSEEERAMAEQTAASLVAHIIRQDGVEAVLAAEATEAVPGWLASIGVDRAYADPYAGLLDGYTYGRNQFYAMIATSPKGDVFKMNPLFDMSTPAQVRAALCDLELAVEAILTGVKQDAPDWHPVLAKNYEAPITYEFGENNGYSTTHFANRRVAVGAAVSLIHETTHMMTPCQVGRISRYMDQWKVEAIAEYLTLTYYNGRLEQAEVFAQMQTDFISQAEDQEAAKEFYELLHQVYLRYAPQPETLNDVDLTLFWRSAVVAKAVMGMQLNSVVNVYAGAGSASLDAVNGNELSYSESEWLASFLINRHGLSAFLHYCLDEGVSFEDAFGMTYQDAKADWLANRSILE